MIMNALEKRAFLKVLLAARRVGWAWGLPAGTLLAPSGGMGALPPADTKSPPVPRQRYPYLNAPLQVGLVGLW